MALLYILQSLKEENRFYLGITSREKDRLEEHNRGQTKSTRKFSPWRIIYTEHYDSMSDAMKREVYLKSIHGYQERRSIIEKYKSVSSSVE